MPNVSRLDTKPGILRCCPTIGLIVLLQGLASCQNTPQHQPRALPPSHAPALATTSESVKLVDAVRYDILSKRSDVRILVFREGPLARLGHNHVIQARNIRGEIYLAPDIHRSSFSIELPVKDFQVDARDMRLEEGEDFSSQPNDEAIAGTARNMLGEKVLDASRFPTIEIRSVALNGPAWGMDVTVRIRMHGVEREIVVPTAVENSGNTLVMTAFFSINQTDFGITPMSVLGGGLRVTDTVKVQIRLVAGKASASQKTTR